MAPKNTCPVLASSKKLQVELPPKRVLTVMRWRLMPHWYAGELQNFRMHTTPNCRQENCFKKKCYSPAIIAGRRCVVMADRYYQWQKVKQPFLVLKCELCCAIHRPNTYSETLTVQTYRLMCRLLTRLQTYEVSSVHVLRQQCFVRWPHWLEAAST